MKTSRSCSDSAHPKRPKPSIILLLTAAFAIGAILAPVHADSAARNSAIAATLATSARDAIVLGYSAEAVRLLDEALSYAPADADANYMRALAGLSGGRSGPPRQFRVSKPRCRATISGYTRPLTRAFSMPPC